MNAHAVASSTNVPNCPDCQSELTFVASWTRRGLWAYDEVQTYECPAHGPLFVIPERSIGVGASPRLGQSRDEGDRDSLIPARLKPTPTLDSDALALPEPDSD